MIKKIVFFTLALIISNWGLAQKYTISGYVSDVENGEKLIGANIYNANSFVGTVTNSYGFYSLTLESGSVNLTVSYVGYSSFQKEINLNEHKTLNIELNSSVEIEEVVVEGKAAVGGVKSSQMSVIEIPMKTIKNLPVLLGEADIIKTIQLLPGVQSGSEGMSGLYVRGGGPDQNLILLDGVPVYNVNHLFGFFSVFNPDAIQNVTLVKGGFPARYGGRLSSVLDISMKEGNIKEFKGSGSVGVISSKLAVEGPIGDKTSYIISGRRTYIDVLTYPIIQMVGKSEGFDKLSLGYFFHNLNAKINHQFSQKSRLYVSAYMGKDKFNSHMKESGSDWNYDEKVQFWWGNITGAVRWNYMINRKLFSNTTFTVSRYKMLTSFEFSDNFGKRDEFEYTSGILDYGAKIDFDYFASPNHTVKFGFAETYHTYNPGVSALTYSEGGEQVSTEFGNNKVYTHELGAYVEDDIRIGSLIKMNIGIRWSGFSVQNTFYNALEPRFSSRFLISDKWSLKGSYAQMNQYINLLANSNIGLPTDLWVPITDKIKPQRANQFALGSIYALSKNIDFSVEGFYKHMDNIVEYKEGATFLSFDNSWENKIAMGEGWSKGIEVLLMKKHGRVSGWIGYTLSQSDRQFNRFEQEIAYGKKFPYKFDRRHDLSFVLTYKLDDRIDFGLTWVFGTGNATTLGYETYPAIIDNDNFDNTYDVTHYENRNNYRMPSYHRMDVSINFHKQKRWGTRTWNLSIYNVYNRQNPFFVNWEYDYEAKKNKLYQYSIFPIMPSVSYKFEF
ncbi:MAG: TonB-dependent receptor [Salinivirgaceae bacterium]|nr:TonB-dependent receptor [Salinivirgaceae bacterium]